MGKIKLPFPELLYPYSPVAKPMPPVPVVSVCESPLVCVSFSCSLVPYLLGLLEVYRWKDSFSGTDEEKTISVGVMRELMEVFAMACCGDDSNVVKIYRIDPDTGRKQVSTDDGVTWEQSPTDIYNQATILPPLAGAAGNAKKCEAANNVIQAMKDTQARWSGYLGALNTILDLETSLIASAVELLFIALAQDELASLASGAIWTVANEARKIFGLTSAAYDGWFTQTVWDDALCILVCESDADGRYDTTSWNIVKNRLKQELDAPPATPGDTLKSMLDAWNVVGLNNATTLHTDNQAACDSCSCADCDNLDDWQIAYGTLLEQTPGYMRLSSVDNGLGQQSVRLVNYVDPNHLKCCAVTWNVISGVNTNQAYYPCGSSDPVFSVPPPETCMYDVNVVNIFGAAMEVEFFFTDCP